jgi:hypothetical protein
MDRRKETPVYIIRRTSLVAVLLVWLVHPTIVTADDKAIVIDEELAAHVVILPVTAAAQKTFKVVDFRFGEFSVVSSKLGVAKGHSGGWISYLEHAESEQKFSFVMRGSSPEVASVTAVQSFESGPLKRHELLPGVSVGVDPLSSAKDRLVATIQVDSAPAATWTLQLNVQRNVVGASEKARASLLTDGVREIEIRNVSSRESSDSEQGTPARGYEFREGDRAIAALQYYGGGYPTSKKHLTVYLRDDLDPRTQLLLASAMTAILQSKLNATLN